MQQILRINRDAHPPDNHDAHFYAERVRNRAICLPQTSLLTPPILLLGPFTSPECFAFAVRLFLISRSNIPCVTAQDTLSTTITGMTSRSSQLRLARM